MPDLPCLKIYFALLLYSYAIHLRKGSYRSLPYSRSSNANSPYIAAATLPDEEEDLESFYTLPVRAPPAGAAHGHNASASISSFADFVSAPPSRPWRGQKPRKTSNLNPANSKATTAEPVDEVDEVLFDEDELAVKGSTDAESLSASGSGGRGSTDDDRAPLNGGSATARRTSRAR